MRDLGHAKDFGHSPKSKGKPSHFITSYTTHPSLAFPERSLAIGEIWKQCDESVNGGTFPLSAVVFSHTSCNLHLSNPPHRFLELRRRQAWRKHGFVKSTTSKVKGFPSSKCDPYLHFLLHDSVERRIGFGVICPGLPSHCQPVPSYQQLSSYFQKWV